MPGDGLKFDFFGFAQNVDLSSYINVTNLRLKFFFSTNLSDLFQFFEKRLRKFSKLFNFRLRTVAFKCTDSAVFKSTTFTHLKPFVKNADIRRELEVLRWHFSSPENLQSGRGPGPEMKNGLDEL